jgi:cobyrinic acid a,c-diamide synthase
LPVVVEQTERPQGHGYVSGSVDGANPFLAEGLDLKGHEFHYSRLKEKDEGLETAVNLDKGAGIGGGRDGIRVANVMATYTHLHALGTPEWADGLVSAGMGGASS